MKKKTFGFLSISILIGALAVPVLAQSTMRLKANVPFEFTVGATTLPAGEYSISLDAGLHLVRLQGSERLTGVISLANWMQLKGDDQAAETKLVFDRYGDKYFLIEVSDGYDSVAMELPESHREREVSKTAPPQAPEMVAVLAWR
jgi:hypothetical protein